MHPEDTYILTCPWNQSKQRDDKKNYFATFSSATSFTIRHEKEVQYVLLLSAVALNITNKLLS